MSIIENGTEYLSTAEASTLLGCSPYWFRKAVVPKYHLVAYQKGIGRMLYYEKAALEAICGFRSAEKQ